MQTARLPATQRRRLRHREQQRIGTVMRSVIYSMGVSLDGFTAGPGGELDWSAPGAELLRFHNEQTRELGVHLCGQGLYEDMLPWEHPDERPPTSELEAEFARIWTDLPKIVFSNTLAHVEGNARLATDGIAHEITRLKEQPGQDIAVGGAGLAGAVMRLDLIDEYRLFVNPILLGGGTPYFPALENRINLELEQTRTFGARVVYMRYRRVNSR